MNVRLLRGTKSSRTVFVGDNSQVIIRDVLQLHAEVERGTRDAPEAEVGAALCAVDALGALTVADFQ